MEAAGSGVVGGGREIRLGVVGGFCPGERMGGAKVEVKAGCSEDFRGPKRILRTRRDHLVEVTGKGGAASIFPPQPGKVRPGQGVGSVGLASLRTPG